VGLLFAKIAWLLFNKYAVLHKKVRFLCSMELLLEKIEKSSLHRIGATMA
jgi:hypothetical protein